VLLLAALSQSTISAPAAGPATASAAKILLTGDVKKAGAYPLDGELTVGALLQKADGVVRLSESAAIRITIVYDVGGKVRSCLPAMTTSLQNGDNVIVAQGRTSTSVKICDADPDRR
jgi:protein involved in polysaccharide export with SLBB domain